MPKYKLHGFVFVSTDPSQDPAKCKLYRPEDSPIEFYGVPSAMMEPLDDAARKAVVARDAAREKAGLAPTTPSPFRVIEQREVGFAVIPSDWEEKSDFEIVGLAKSLGAPNRTKADAARQFIAAEIEKRKLG